MEQKTILLIVPPVFGLDQAISDNLKHHGFNVIILNLNPDNFHYTNIWYRLYNTYRKVFCHDRSFKQKLLEKWQCMQIHQLLKQYPNIDYSLLIAPHNYAPSVLQTVKLYTPSMIAYFCDGLNKFPDLESTILQSISLYKKTFVFNPADLKRHSNLSLIGITNFYFDSIHPLSQFNNNHQQLSAYFVGSHNMYRLEKIQNLINILIKF